VLASGASGATVGLSPYRLAQTMAFEPVGRRTERGWSSCTGFSLEEAPAMSGAAGDPPLDRVDDLSADEPQNVPEANSGLLLAGGGCAATRAGGGAEAFRARRRLRNTGVGTTCLQSASPL